MESQYNKWDKTQIYLFCNQVKPSARDGYILLGFWPTGSVDPPPSPKHHKLLPRLLISLHNLTVTPHCWKKICFYCRKKHYVERWCHWGNSFWIQKPLSQCKWELSYSAFPVPCQPNDQLSAIVCRKSLTRINPVMVMVPPDVCLSSACGNKTLCFKWKRIMGKKRHSNAHWSSFLVLICIMGSPKFTRWNHNEWPFVKALADALVTFKLKNSVSFFPPRMIMILSLFPSLIWNGVSAHLSEWVSTPSIPWVNFFADI